MLNYFVFPIIFHIFASKMIDDKYMPKLIYKVLDYVGVALFILTMIILGKYINLF